MLHKLPNSGTITPNRNSVFSMPKTIRMMDYNAICFIFNSQINKLISKANPRHDFCNLVVSLNTKTIYTIIFKKLRLQQVIQPGREKR